MSSRCEVLQEHDRSSCSRPLCLCCQSFCANKRYLKPVCARCASQHRFRKCAFCGGVRCETCMSPCSNLPMANMSHMSALCQFFPNPKAALGCLERNKLFQVASKVAVYVVVQGKCKTGGRIYDHNPNDPESSPRVEGRLLPRLPNNPPAEPRPQHPAMRAQSKTALIPSTSHSKSGRRGHASFCKLAVHDCFCNVRTPS